jgi:hypothetical protein
VADGTTFTTFLPALNSGGCFAGQCDWRLPTTYELQTIVSETFPCSMSLCIDPIFGPTVASTYYWSATTFATFPPTAWFVNFYGGDVGGNVTENLYAVRAVLDHMMARQSGKIIIVTTDAGRMPTKGESLIGGAAAAVVLMTKALAMELARTKIHINTICTTVTKDTPGYEKATSMQGTRIADIFKKAEERMPFGMNKPDDIAQLALFLASKDSNQITGQIFSISGGLSFPG